MPTSVFPQFSAPLTMWAQLLTINRHFAKLRPLLKYYGNQPSTIFMGANANNHYDVV